MSKAGKGKKAKKKTPKEQIKELTDEKTQLTEELIALRNQHEELGSKLSSTVFKLLEGVKRSDFKIKASTPLLAIPTDTLLSIVDKMIVKKRIDEVSVEARVEELEVRVTKMSMDIARMTKKCSAYENGLDDLLGLTTVEDMRDKVYQLQVVAGHEYHTFSANEIFSTVSQECQNHQKQYLDEVNSHQTEKPLKVKGPKLRPQSAADRIEADAVKFNLIPPTYRAPGDTHIKDMNGDLRLLIMNELSLEKASGADWRMLAERAGISLENITYWKSLRLECPMGRVMTEWAQSPVATVRMLHRHLSSPQMRCTLLAKRIADMYDVN